MKEANALLEVDNLETCLHTASSVIRAVDRVSFEVREGEAVALMGESGCGKTMTALSITRLAPAMAETTGRVLYKGVDLLSLPMREFRKMLCKEIGIVFQDPLTYLNPTQRVLNQIAESMMTHLSLSKQEASERATGILNKMGFPASAVGAFPHQLSGGMRQRILIAIAVSCNPGLIIADEPTTALDSTVQTQIISLIKSLQRESHASLLLITHDFGVAAAICDRVLVMYAGQIVEEGDIESVYSSPKHPYTQGLIKLSKSMEESGTIDTLPGNPPDIGSIGSIPHGCRFNPRCPNVMNVCQAREPPWINAQDSVRQGSRCWLYSS